MVIIHQLSELAIDVLKSLAIRLKSIDKMWFTVHKLLGYNGTAQPLEISSPMAEIGTFVRRA